MSVNELLPTLREPNRADKLRVMPFWVLEMAKEAGAWLKAGRDDPVRSPYNAFEAASTLLDALRVDNEQA